MFLKDALAQTFRLSKDGFISSVDLYFSHIDENDVVTLEIRNTVNGYPGEIIYGESLLDTSTVKRVSGIVNNQAVYSDTTWAKTPAKFYFPQIVRVKKDVSYALVISGSSKNTRLFISRMGEIIPFAGASPDANSPDGSVITFAKQLETQPSLGSCFSSTNGETWTAQQLDDIKYDIYMAKFKTQTGKLVLKSKKKAQLKLKPFPFESEINSPRVRVFAENHSLNVGEVVPITMFQNVSNVYIRLSTPSTPDIFPGHTITTTTGTAKVTHVFKSDVEPLVRYCHIEFITGNFQNNQAFQTDKYIEIVDVSDGTKFYLDNRPTQFVRDSSSGTITTSFQFPTMNGIPSSYLVKTHTVLQVDSINSFIIDVGINANASGKFGPYDVLIETNFKYDLFNFFGNYQNFSSNTIWSLQGRYHGQKDGPFQSKHKLETEKKPIIVSNDMYLEVPSNYFSQKNLPNSSSMVVTADITTPNLYETPVIDLDSFKMNLISNQVDLSFLNMDVAPNATGRSKAETLPVDGTSQYKWVTKNIQLANAAEDLRILFSVYQDEGASFSVFVKKLSSDETTSLENTPWVEITGFKKPVDNSRNPNDKIEIDFVTSDLGIVGWDSVPFTSFKIKLVGKATNSCKPPLFYEFRAIAIT